MLHSRDPISLVCIVKSNSQTTEPAENSKSVFLIDIQWRSDWVAWVDNVQGPRSLLGPERQREKEEKEKEEKVVEKEKERKKKKREKKRTRERNFSNTQTGTQLDISP